MEKHETIIPVDTGQYWAMLQAFYKLLHRKSGTQRNNRTATERAVKRARLTMNSYLALKKITRKELSKELGCSEETINNMYSDPLRVRSEYILILQEKLDDEMKDNFG